MKQYRTGIVTLDETDLPFKTRIEVCQKHNNWWFEGAGYPDACQECVEKSKPMPLECYNIE